MSKLLDAALEYAEAGISVFPLSPRTKCAVKGSHGVHDATTNVEQIKKWWTDNPDYNIGVACGKINGFMVADVDFDDGCRKDFMQSIPPTVIARTPTKNFHPYIKYDATVRNGLIVEKGVTIRSDGYYVVAPPSIHPDTGTEYEFYKNGHTGKFTLLDGASLCECPEWIIEVAKIGGTKLPSAKNTRVGDRHHKLIDIAWAMANAGKTKDETITACILANNAFKDGPKNTEEVLAAVDSAFKKIEVQPEPEEVETKPKEILRFPIEAFPTLLENIASEISRRVGAPIEMCASSVLSACALSCQEFYNVELFGAIKPISLFFITIAKSGERKTAVDYWVLRQHNLWRKAKFQQYESDFSQYKQNLEQWKTDCATKKFQGEKPPQPTAPKAPVLFVSEPTIEGLFYCLKNHCNSVGLFSDEGGAFLGGHSMKMDNAKATWAKYNKLWDGSPIDRIRKGKEDGEIDVLYDKKVSLHLMIQPTIAEELFNDEHAKGQGFLARCLSCHPKSKIGDRLMVEHSEPSVEMNYFYSQVNRWLNKIGDPAVLLRTSEGGKSILYEFYSEVEGAQKSGCKYCGITDFASKALEHCLRIAGVLEVFCNEQAREISPDAMLRATVITRFYLDSQVEISEKNIMYPSRACEAVHKSILRRDRWSMRDLARSLTKKYCTKDVLVPILTDLANAGFIEFDAQAKTIKTK